MRSFVLGTLVAQSGFFLCCSIEIGGAYYRRSNTSVTASGTWYFSSSISLWADWESKVGIRAGALTCARIFAASALVLCFVALLLAFYNELMGKIYKPEHARRKLAILRAIGVLNVATGACSMATWISWVFYIKDTALAKNLGVGFVFSIISMVCGFVSGPMIFYFSLSTYVERKPTVADTPVVTGSISGLPPPGPSELWFVWFWRESRKGSK